MSSVIITGLIVGLITGFIVVQYLNKKESPNTLKPGAFNELVFSFYIYIDILKNLSGEEENNDCNFRTNNVTTAFSR